MSDFVTDGTPIPDSKTDGDDFVAPDCNALRGASLALRTHVLAAESSIAANGAAIAAITSAVVASYEVDFSTVANNAFAGGDGQYSMGGINWTVYGKSAGATTFQNLNGTGLQMVRSGTDIGIIASLRKMFPTIAVPWIYRVRIWVEFVSGTILVPNNFCWLLLGLASSESNAASYVVLTGRRSGNDTGVAQQHFLGLSQSGISASNAITITNLTDNIYQMEFSNNIVEVFSSSGTSLADDSTLSYRGTPAGQLTQAPAVDWSIQVACSSATGTAGTIKRIRVELR